MLLNPPILKAGQPTHLPQRHALHLFLDENVAHIVGQLHLLLFK